MASTDHLLPDQIKAYLQNTLDDEARFAIENHLLDCELCNAAVEGFAASYDFDKDRELEKLAPRYSESRAAAEAQIRPLRRNYTWLNRIAVAAAFLILPLAAWMYWQSQSTERLFQQYHSTYTSDFLALRSTDTNDPLLEKAVQEYQSQDYDQSLSLFEDFLEQEPEHIEAAFHAGLACLEIGQSRKAIAYLEKVRFNDEQYYEDASWYLCLAHLQVEEQAKALAILERLLKIEKGYYEEQAKALREQLSL